TQNDSVVKKVVDTMTKLGLTPRLIKSGGGSDTNIFNAKGISTVNLGMGAEDVHTDEEYVPVQELSNMAQLLVELVKI
ncbi:MAG: M20/M25/M40 family metallo-hydrolase, partial [Candidatus Aquicultor sp.]